MIVAAGTRLGPYEILSAIGAGGMGEVYRARDTKLGREVAIKILPAVFTSDPERRARFDREARMLAALNHPHIAQIFGFEEADHTHALVMELVEGETVGERIEGLRAKGKGLALDEALAIARQIADALEYAHEHGIIHRDLKPANIMVTPAGAVKVLDFGLAKAVAGDGSGVDLSQAPTVTGTGTRAGVVLGTPAYMSPEQARGKPVDKRTDIWAFGCVLFELVCGRAAFAGETTNDVVAKILERDPDWRALPETTPAGVRHLLQRCLEKDVNRRLHDIGDARVDLDDALNPRRASASGPSNRAAWRTGAWLVAAAAAAGAVGIGLYTWRASSSRERSGTEVGQNQWVQLTRLPDTVSQPALSSDGRMLTFVRGPDTFLAPGEIYVKMLPAGEAVQLTHDGAPKMSPVFSPDSSQIAYTAGDSNTRWDTWLVPISNGQPHLWLPNASGLVWWGTQRILFSEIKNNDLHMAIVTAEVSRAGARDVYVPADERGMAHRSYPSPDGRWALAVEMDRGDWIPCRLVPMDGGSPGRPVGPPGVGCTSAAWSRDGKWMYLNSGAGGAFHIWRQRFPDGQPEQVTSGATEEEGIAMAPDDRSFVTAVGLRQSAVWLYDARGERQVTVDGYGFDPKFTTDGTRLVYRILSGAVARSTSGELRVLDVESGHSEPLLPGFAATGLLGRAYDISSDGRQVVVATIDRDGKRRLWLAPLDRRTPPRQIPNVQGDQPAFGADDEILFRAIEGTSAFGYRVHQDGTGLRKVIEQPIAALAGISRDSQWLVVKLPGADGSITAAVPMGGGSPVPIAAGDASESHLQWSADGRSIFVSVPQPGQTSGHTYVVPLMSGQMFPSIPARGFGSGAVIANLSGARLIDGFDVVPGPTPEGYAFSRQTVQRNLYRIPIR
jgi:serine/threonine protein kinase